MQGSPTPGDSWPDDVSYHEMRRYNSSSVGSMTTFPTTSSNTAEAHARTIESWHSRPVRVHSSTPSCSSSSSSPPSSTIYNRSSPSSSSASTTASLTRIWNGVTSYLSRQKPRKKLRSTSPTIRNFKFRRRKGGSPLDGGLRGGEIIGGGKHRSDITMEDVRNVRGDNNNNINNKDSITTMRKNSFLHENHYRKRRRKDKKSMSWRRSSWAGVVGYSTLIITGAWTASIHEEFQYVTFEDYVKPPRLNELYFAGGTHPIELNPGFWSTEFVEPYALFRGR